MRCCDSHLVDVLLWLQSETQRSSKPFEAAMVCSGRNGMSVHTATAGGILCHTCFFRPAKSSRCHHDLMHMSRRSHVQSRDDSD